MLETLSDEESYTDNLAIETISITLDEDGEIDEVIDTLEVIEEHTFNEPED